MSQEFSQFSPGWPEFPRFPPGWDSVTNAEGLTWVEWAYAVGVDPSPGTFETMHALYSWRNRWASGEDPTEYRAQPVSRKP